MIRVEDIKYCLDETRECLDLVESFFLAADLTGNINYKRALELKNYPDHYMYIYKTSTIYSNISIKIKEYKDEEKNVCVDLSLHFILTQRNGEEIDLEKVDNIKTYLDKTSGVSCFLNVRQHSFEGAYPFLHLVVPAINVKNVVEILNFIEEKILIEGVTK